MPTSAGQNSGNSAPFTAELSLLLLETQITAQCSGKISQWEERVWTRVGKSAELIV